MFYWRDQVANGLNPCHSGTALQGVQGALQCTGGRRIDRGLLALLQHKLFDDIEINHCLFGKDFQQLNIFGILCQRLAVINGRFSICHRGVICRCRGGFRRVTVVMIINAIGQGRIFTLGQGLCCNHQLGDILRATVIGFFRKCLGQIGQQILDQPDNRHQGGGNGYSFFNQLVKQMLDRPGYSGELICTHHASTTLEGVKGTAYLNDRLVCVG